MADTPLSAIDWLSETVTEDATTGFGPETPVTVGIETPNVSVAALTPKDAKTIGTVSNNSVGVPQNLWHGSDARTLIAGIQTLPSISVPSLQQLLMDLMRLEADAPLATNGNEFLIARLDKLLEIGALTEANALINKAETQSPQMFRRAFDISLLQGTEDAMCDQLRRTPDIAPTFQARIFCLARGGDWTAAALTLETGEALDLITKEDDILFARFLEPELNDGAGTLPPPSKVTPLVFRVREAIGEHLSTTALPTAFAHADLRSTAGWKAQLEAAERLTAAGVMTPADFANVYMQRKPAASGGVWDRVAAFQKFDQAVTSGNVADITTRLAGVWPAMQAARTEYAFARLYDAKLAQLDLPPQGAQLAYKLTLLASPKEAAGKTVPSTRDTFLRAIAQGQPVTRTDDPLQVAIVRAFATRGLPQDFRSLRRPNQQGEALLKAIRYFAEGLEGDRNRLSQALQALRTLGYEDLAISAAIEAVIQSERPS
jgi:hypothetical protein